MISLRHDARRVLDTRRERAVSSPAPVVVPMVSTVATASVTAGVLLLAGAGLAVVAVAVVIVALCAVVAAHRTVSSLVAGVTLWLIRPYRNGERVRIYLPERGEAAVAEIVRIGLLNTSLVSRSGMFVVANTRLLRAAPECRR